tara:strand:- start:122 stop:328 length:207 start_codon:yes stop_codon:yes gene_type:complete
VEVEQILVLVDLEEMVEEDHKDLLLLLVMLVEMEIHLQLVLRKVIMVEQGMMDYPHQIILVVEEVLVL